MKKCWCQQNSWDVSRDLFIFWMFFRKGIIVSRFIIIGHVWQILGSGGVFALLHPWAAMKRPILIMSKRTTLKVCVPKKKKIMWKRVKLPYIIGEKKMNILLQLMRLPRCLCPFCSRSQWNPLKNKWSRNPWKFRKSY